MATVEFKARKISITIDDPDDAQEFLNGLILAKQNNNSAYFPQLIAGVNAVLEPYHKALRAEHAKGIGPDAELVEVV
jgi:hypothetical protein